MGRLLIGAVWVFNKPQLKYYDIERKQIVLINDNNYQNHWLSDQKNENSVRLYDALHDKNVTLYRQEFGKPDETANNYEHKIRKHYNYILTKQLVTGAIYNEKGKLEKPVLNTSQKNALTTMVMNALDDPEYEQYLEEYTDILSQPIPDIKRCAVDIEVATVDGVFPSLEKAQNAVTCIGFASSDGYRATYTLNKYHKKSDENLDYVTYFDKEEDLLRAAMLKIKQYPMIITFNGDSFDLAYLYMRCEKLEIENPIRFNKLDINRNLLQSDAVLIHRGIHLDLFRIFYNRSLHNYAFNARYKQFGLDPIAQAMIGEGKIKNDKPLMELTQEELSKYCLNDAEITLKLTTYSNGLLIKLLILISRITKSSIEDIGRFGISNWIKQMIYFEHRKKKILIPNRDELFIKGAGETAAIIKGKKYAGAMVITPSTGAYFNVSVVDFASLYPSIIKKYNISYETINCGHEECKDHKIPNTTHYTCTRKIGMLPLLIGVFRDLRVEYFKRLSKTLTGDEQDLYEAVSQAIKVILNGTYGVLGADNFQLYCLPVAESVTAVGRHIINETKEHVESLGLKVIYGDTDSLFIHNADKKQLDTLITRTNKTYGIDLEVDKHYRYIIFAARKKNYLGVKDDSKLDIKGLVGKKSHIPKIIKDCFNDICYVLQKVRTKEELNEAKVTIASIIKECNKNMSEFIYPMENYAFHAAINKDIDKYGIVVQEEGLNPHQLGLISTHKIWNEEKKKGVPIHVKVAKEMEDEEGIEVALKQFIPYIKCRGGEGKSLTKAQYTDIDIEKYRETLESVVNPILEVLDMEFQTIALHKQKTLDEIFA